MESWHLVTPDGLVYSAGAAVEPLVRVVGRGRPLAAFARRFPRLTDAAYRWVARHRSRLGRLTRGRRAAAERHIEQRARRLP